MDNDNKKIITIGIGTLVVIAVLFYAFNAYSNTNSAQGVPVSENTNTTGAARHLSS